MHKIDHYFITDINQYFEGERQRLLGLKASDPDWWASQNSEWARKQFGETLTEKDGRIHPNGESVAELACAVCGEITADKVLSMKFSFCEEYSCGLNMCLGCLKKLTSELEAVL